LEWENNLSRFNATFDGGVVAEPERIGKDGNGLKLVVYVNEERKNKDTGDYEKTGNVSKIQVALWGDLANEDVRYGDLVEVDASLTEHEYEKQDGSKGRQLQTTWVNSIVVKWRKGEGAVAASSSADSGLPW
jgi:single-stranded DNA-binding protein